MSNVFRKATRAKAKLRMALDGPAGAGKSITGLRFAFALAEHEAKKRPQGQQDLRIGAIDTEAGSLSKYAGYQEGKDRIEFSVVELDSFSPGMYCQMIEASIEAGFDVLLIDSLSHAWTGKDGALAQVDKKASQNKGNSFTAWKDITPQHNRLVDTILRAPLHVIATMRTKMEHILEEKVNAQGRLVQTPKKIGMKPIQREGMEYEFDIVADLDVDHVLTISKTRCPAIDGEIIMKPGPGWLNKVIRWLDTGESKPSTAWRKVGVSDDLVERIHAAANSLGMSTEETKKQIFARYSTDSILELTQAQAEEFATKLEAKARNASGGTAKIEKPEASEAPAVEAAESKPAAAAAAAATKPPAGTAGAGNTEFSDKVSSETLDYIRQARAEYFVATELVDISEQNQKWASILKKRGVANDLELTEEQGKEVGESLGKRIREIYAEAGHPDLAPDWLWH